jgi:cytochrome c553
MHHGTRLSLAAAAMIVALTFSGLRSVAADMALGEYLSSECVTCHQLSGNYAGIRPIVGWPEPLFIKTIGEYRQKKRDNPIMQTIAGRLTDEEVAALAAYFGSLKSKVK